jgi:arylsulfatase A-like enzyme
MRAAGVLERTVIAVTSDHGESFGEAGYFQHGPQLDESVVRVPLIICLPEGHPALSRSWVEKSLQWVGLKRSGRGVNFDGLVRVTDVFPTILDAVGLPIPDNLDGISLLPVIAGDELPDLWAYAENGRSFVGVDPDRHVAGIDGKMRMIRDADWKMIFVPKPGGGETRLYDLHTLPLEARNVAEENPAKVDQMRQRLQSVIGGKETGDGPERELTEAEKEQLRNLGYL